MNHPQPNEYSPFAAGYIALASQHEDVIALLNELKTSTHKLFVQLPADKADYAYGEGKWTIKQSLSHMIDTERVFAYRAYCISKGDQSAFPSFDQDSYVNNSYLDNCTLANLADEFKTVRESSLQFINRLTEEQICKFGTASNHPVTVRAIIHMIAGHELHHLNILKERYL